LMLERVRADGLLAPGHPVLVLLSGGRDSTCLLDLAVQIAGSGAVGISIAAERPQASVDLVEVSEDAAAVARRNAERLAAGRVRVITGDLYAALPEKVRYDAIAANPPYVPIADAKRLAPDVVQHEPHLAGLFRRDAQKTLRSE